MKTDIRINGQLKSFNVKTDETLLDTLRRHGYVGVKKGCDASTCCVCAVLLDDKPVLSCSLLTVRLEGRHVTTIEGIPETASRLSALFGDEGADQCGFCNPSVAIVVHAMAREGIDDENGIRHYLGGHLCRCSGYQAQLLAIKKFLGVTS